MDATDIFGKWQVDPIAFVWDNFSTAPHFTGPDAWQEDVLRALPNNNRIAMKACKGPGKTTTLSWAAWWFMATRNQPNIAAVSITGDNLRDGFWKEMAKWQQYSPVLSKMFKVTKTRIFNPDFPDTWWISARTFPKQGDAMQQADALAGLHQDYIMAIMDEAGGIPDAVMATAEAMLATAQEAKIIIAGNPTHLSGPLFRACTQERQLWHLTTITGDPDDPQRSPRISVQWAREQIEKYGRDNPWVQVNVFGNFPQSSLNQLVGPEDVAAAMRRKFDADAVKSAQHRLGVDVARFGDDRTVLIRRQGMLAHKPQEFRGLRTNEIGALVLKEVREFGVESVFVDDTGGWGAGVIDFLIQNGQACVPVNFSSKPIDNRYLNKRAEMWFGMTEWVKARGCLTKNDEMIRELSAPTYTFLNGKFRIEDKELIKGRLGYSPDIADALALTFALPEMPSGAMQIGGGGGKQKDWDYDPFEKI